MQPNTRDKTVDWMESLGTKFVEVWFCHKGGFGDPERHVDDPDTLLETIRMSMQRLGPALWRDAGRWSIMRRDGTIKTYPSREAAEMVMIHRGA